MNSLPESVQHPLVVDLDGTLTPTDTLLELVLVLLRRRVWLLPQLFLWMFQGRAVFKTQVASAVRLDMARLPWREDFIAWLHDQRQSGRRIVLATAAHRQIAQDVAALHPLFDSVLATDGVRNLKGENKLQAIREHVGSDFSYAGDSGADLAVWRGASSAVLVGASARVAQQARAMVPVEREFTAAPLGLKGWLKAIRAHQWLKNLLLFVPIFTSFTFTQVASVAAAVMAFAAFSLAASATYLMNDMWDLDADRQHPRKRKRPLASGQLTLFSGAMAAALLMLTGCLLAYAVSVEFLLLLLGYVLLTTAYSWSLKSYVLMDVVMLALLYTYRVLTGAVVIGVALSPWLLAFSVFTFLSLALVKRCAELVDLQASGRQSSKGRDYQVGDLVVLWPLGVGAGLSAVVVFGLFVGSQEARAAYGDTSALWLVGIGLIYWLARMWIKTSRGEMHDDPIVFALKDRGSRVAVAGMLAIPALVHFLIR